MRNRLGLAALAALLGLVPLAAQSVELVLRLPSGGGADPAFAALESGAMDRFFDAGLVLTGGTEVLEPDIEGLCAASRGAYVDWLLVLDLEGAASAARGDESLTWTLYRSADAARAGSGPLSLPRAARQLADREARLRALGEAAAASVLTFMRTKGGAAADSLLPSSGG